MTGPIFIGGAPRSGLTLLRVILDAHPAISCGPDIGHTALTMTSADFETTLGTLHRDHFFLDPEMVRANFARAIAAPMEKRAVAHGKRRWADKTAFNILVFERLATLFPAARFIHLVRDGRDVAASLLERRWRSPTGALFDQCARAAGAARYWASLIARGLQAEADAALTGRILRLRYEDLAAQPDKTLRSLCRFIGEEFDPDILKLEKRRPALAGLELETADRLMQPIGTQAVRRWRRDLRPEEASAAFAAYEPLFKMLGYAPD